MKFLSRAMAVCGALLLVSPCSVGSPVARADGTTAGPTPAPRRVSEYVERDFTVAGTPVQGSTKQEDAPRPLMTARRVPGTTILPWTPATWG